MMGIKGKWSAIMRGTEKKDPDCSKSEGEQEVEEWVREVGCRQTEVSGRSEVTSPSHVMLHESQG